MKHISLESILTPSEIARARELYRESVAHLDAPRKVRSASEHCAAHASFNARVVAEIVKPNLARIDAATGQANDARFIGYAIEYCLLHESAKPNGPRRDKAWK